MTASPQPSPHHQHYNGPYPKPKSVVKSGPDQRVSQAERDAVIEQLRLNTADGRLDMDEFSERVEQALAARHGRDLTPLLADLAHIEQPRDRRRHRRAHLVGMVVPYVSVSGLLIVIWALAGFGYFWPIWVIGIWGVVVVMDLLRLAGTGTRAQLPPGGGPRQLE